MRLRAIRFHSSSGERYLRRTLDDSMPPNVRHTGEQTPFFRYAFRNMRSVSRIREDFTAIRLVRRGRGSPAAALGFLTSDR